MELTLQAIRERIGGELVGDGGARVTGVNALEIAQPGDLVFAEHERHLPLVQKTPAAAVIVATDFPAVTGKNLLRVAKPREAFVMAMMLFQPPKPPAKGVHPTASVSPKATLEADVTVGECCVVRAGARIGRGTILESGVHVGEDAVIGQDCWFAPNVVVMRGVRIGSRVILHGGAVIGGDGFGFIWVKDHHEKVPQLGTVIIEDDVEIGCNVCVDRATFGATVVGRGTKIDNLVQIAHNDLIGKHVIMAGQVGFAGTVTVGDGAMFGGQSGVVDHITIGAGAKIGAASPVTRDVKPGEMVWGFPARPIARAKRDIASASIVPKLMQKLREQADELRRLASLIDARSGAPRK